MTDHGSIPVFAEDIHLDTQDSKVLLAFTGGGRIASALIPPVQTAALAVQLLHWTSRQQDGSDSTVRGDPLMPRDLYFEAGRSIGHIVLAIDLGLATVRVEVPHEQLVAALAQLNFETSDRPTPN